MNKKVKTRTIVVGEKRSLGKTVCGLDVHKDSVFCCILSTDGRKIQHKFGSTIVRWDELGDSYWKSRWKGF